MAPNDESRTADYAMKVQRSQLDWVGRTFQNSRNTRLTSITFNAGAHTISTIAIGGSEVRLWRRFRLFLPFNR